ncbi:gliding motility-associated C-terminal domain-containing protein, partial [Pontibacter silvestris]
SKEILIVVIRPFSNNIISTETNDVCYNEKPAPLTGTTPEEGIKPYKYQWEVSFDNVTYNIIPGATAESYQPGELTTTTWFKRTVLAEEVCGKDLASNALKIHVDKPIAGNDILTASSVTCSGTQPLLLQGSEPAGETAGYTYQWLYSTKGPDKGFSPAPGVNTLPDYQPPVLYQTTWYKRVVNSGFCQQDTSSDIKVEVIPLPATPQSSNSTSTVVVCAGNTVTLGADVSQNEKAEWYDAPQGGQLLYTGTNFTTPKPLWSDATYYVQAVNTQGCSSTERETFKIHVVTPKAVASEDATIIEGKQIQLSAKGGETYSWSPAVGLSSSTSPRPMASPTQTTTYTVTATTPEGCSATDQVTITVIPRIIPANVITANNDGYNDRFIIKNIEYYPECYVEIYTRWGEKIFESHGYKEAWDGTKNGKPMPVSAYYYIIRLNNQEEPVSGSITIIK